MPVEILISIGNAAKQLGVSQNCLRAYPKEIVSPVETPGGHRRYRLSDIKKLQGIFSFENSESACIYCRVSSQDQKVKGDLDRQKARLLDYVTKNSIIVTDILEEVGSGMNDNRPKLKKLFNLINSKKISKVIVEHKDRLTRFNFEVLSEYFLSHGVSITVLNKELDKSFEEELTQDIISLMTSFSARLYGKRSHKNKENDKKL